MRLYYIFRWYYICTNNCKYESGMFQIFPFMNNKHFFAGYKYNKITIIINYWFMVFLGEIGEFKKFNKISCHQIYTSQYLDIYIIV